MSVGPPRKLLATGMLPFTAAWQQLRPGLRILMYHRVRPVSQYDQLSVTPSRFEAQLSVLAARARIVSLEQALAEWKEAPRRPASVAVTFDDGYRDNLLYALPALRRFGVPATVFVTTCFCDQTRVHPRYAGEPGPVHLDWDEVRWLGRQAGISIGSHGVTHARLAQCTDEESWQEIVGSRQAIERELGDAAPIFCYPSGDFGAREVRYVRDAGYRAAVTVAPGVNRAATDVFSLRRTEMTDRDGPLELRLKLAGAFDPMHSLLHRRRLSRFSREAGRMGTA